MIYGYIRVSTDKQTTENQRFEILTFAHERHLSVDRWIEETISATKKLSDRKLAAVTKLSGKDDLIREYLEKQIPVSVIARLLNVNRLTVRHYIRTRKLQKPTP